MSADTRTVTFLELLRGTARRCGLDPATLANEEAAALAEHLTMAARTAWQHYDWPDVTPTEQRQFRPNWASGTAYAIGDEVYDPTTTAYYRAVQAGTNHAPSTDGVINADYWELPTDFRYNLDLLATGQNPIGEVLGIWDQDPDKHSTAMPIGFHLTPSAAVCDRRTVTPLVFVRYRRPSPRFTTTEWASGTTYAAGDLVYAAPDCYLCLAASTGEAPAATVAKWRVQNIPTLFENAVKFAAKAEWLAADSQDSKSMTAYATATVALDDATATISDQQGQTRTYGVRTRTRGNRSYGPRRLST